MFQCSAGHKVDRTNAIVTAHCSNFHSFSIYLESEKLNIFCYSANSCYSVAVMSFPASFGSVCLIDSKCGRELVVVNSATSEQCQGCELIPLPHCGGFLVL